MAGVGVNLRSGGRDKDKPNPYLPPQRPSYLDLSSIAGLHPRDHSFDRGVIRQLDPELFDETVNSSDVTNVTGGGEEEERLKTFLRIRPISYSCGSSIEIKDDQTVIAKTNKKQLKGESKKLFEFKFTKVLGQECGQSTVYEECVHPVIEKFLRHENCLIFSYGATNSGKTYTMQGYGNQYGIIPRTLDVIFGRLNDLQYRAANIKPHLYQSFIQLNPREVGTLIEKRKKIIADANIKQELMSSFRITTSELLEKCRPTAEFIGGPHMYDSSSSSISGSGWYSNSTLYSLWVSYAELYNERVYDLLDTTSIGKTRRRKELKLIQDRNGYVYIKDLTELPVTSDEEAYKLFVAGRKNLQFAATQMNQNSSRSHSFFTIRVVSVGVEGNVPYPKSVHRMTFCDLAGMERANQTENKGFRLQESGNINNSLTILLKVIRVLREKQQCNNRGILETIPFRESKLTHIFKSFFTSSTHICMLVNVNPDPVVADSTIQVLQNSAVASNVIVFRPLDLNSQPDNVVKGKPPLPPSARVDCKNITEKSTSETDDSSDTDCYGLETVVQPKTLLERYRLLEAENARLKLKLEKCEAEKNQLREEAIKAINKQTLRMRKRMHENQITEENVFHRRISLMKHQHQRQLSQCTGYAISSPPKIDMEDIEETFEDSEVEVEDTDDSDKEN